MTVMASFNRWNGDKVHGNKHLLTDVLRGQLGFEGFVVSDWNGIGEVAGCTDASCHERLMRASTWSWCLRTGVLRSTT